MPNAGDCLNVVKPSASSRSGAPVRVSFEFFPPKTRGDGEGLWESIERLAPLQPNFVSVTYGAGGSTRERTHATVARIAHETDLKPAAHLTCVGASKGEIDGVMRGYRGAGVRHIVALRGDPPGGPDAPYAAHPDGYQRHRRSRRRNQGDRRFRSVGLGLSREASAEPELCCTTSRC